MAISIVIVTWNGKELVRECLESLIQVTLDSPAEIIVVDNASSDGTCEMVRERFPQVALIQNGCNLGFARANNIGIDLSSGDYVFLINSDVNVPSDCIVKMVKFMDRHRDIGLLGPTMLGPDGTIRRSSMRFPTLWNAFCRALALDSLFGDSRLFGGYLMRDFSHNRNRAVDVLNGWFWMVRREALEQVGTLDERFFMYGEDIDWCKRFWRCGWSVVFFSEAAAIHYGGGSSSNAPIRFCLEMQRANVQYWKKHNSCLSTFCYLLLVGLHHLVRMGGYAVAYAVRQSARRETAFKMKRTIACLRWLVESCIRGEC